MKRFQRILFLFLFLVISIAVISFLHLFTKEPDSMYYIEWESQTVSEEKPDTYLFTGDLPKDLPAGYLLFETSGISAALSINENVIWQSESSLYGDTYNMSQAKIPLSAETEGNIEMTVQVLDEASAMFPPLVRFCPENMEWSQPTAIANLIALPTGAAALAFVLIFGIFLLGIYMKSTNYSLIPLLAAVGGLVAFRITQSEGVYFLPSNITAILQRQEVGIFIILSFLIYLVMNRKRDFWKQLGISAGTSIAALLICYLVSLSQDGYLAKYLGLYLPEQLRAGLYDGLLYWLTLWLTFSAALISANGVIKSFSEQKLTEQNLRLKNELASRNYQDLVQRMQEKASLLHEWKHQLMALDCLCQKGDFEGIQEMSAQLMDRNSLTAPVHFSDNPTINILLNDTSSKASSAQINFKAYVDVPETLPFPEEDLCILLMNLLENALEAAKKVPETDNRYISIHIKVTAANLLAIKCENSFCGELIEDKHGNLLTTKEDKLSHGFGFRQMLQIAGKYNSTILKRNVNGSIFIAETALKIPEEKA